MSQFIKCNVVMLSTQSKSIYKNAILKTYSNKFTHPSKLILSNVNAQHGNTTPLEQQLWKGNLELQHLYITSDEEIKKNDWCYNSKRKSIELGKYMIGTNEFIFCKKIIATTDTSLGLPQLPQQFIEKYIEEYNKGNVITKVMVEYVQVPNSVFIQVLEAPYIQLKINSDNTINIKPIKVSWNREEVIKLLKSMPNFFNNSIDKQIELRNQWIEENL